MRRYARQIAVPAFGLSGQARLHESRVLVVGAGGLATPVLHYLTGAGVGHMRLVDPDRVDISNLHRQTLFRQDDIGKPKSSAAAEHLLNLNPDSVIEPVHAVLDPANVADLADGVGLVIDCADSFAASYILSDMCHRRRLPLISASVIGLDGYVGGFCGAAAPGLRAVFPDLPQRMGNCADDGVLGPVVGVIGALQAQMTMAVLAGIQPSPLGRLITFDARTWRFGGFTFSGASEPASCPAFIAVTGIRPEDFIVDLRRPDEGALAHPNAIRLSADAFGPGGPIPATGQRAVLCCATGLRAWNAAEKLAAYWRGEIALVAVGNMGEGE